MLSSIVVNSLGNRVSSSHGNHLLKLILLLSLREYAVIELLVSMSFRSIRLLSFILEARSVLLEFALSRCVMLYYQHFFFSWFTMIYLLLLKPVSSRGCRVCSLAFSFYCRDYFKCLSCFCKTLSSYIPQY